jgi:hypothetical protein
MRRSDPVSQERGASLSNRWATEPKRDTAASKFDRGGDGLGEEPGGVAVNDGGLRSGEDGLSVCDSGQRGLGHPGREPEEPDSVPVNGPVWGPWGLCGGGKLGVHGGVFRDMEHGRGHRWSNRRVGGRGRRPGGVHTREPVPNPGGPVPGPAGRRCPCSCRTPHGQTRAVENVGGRSGHTPGGHPGEGGGWPSGGLVCGLEGIAGGLLQPGAVGNGRDGSMSPERPLGGP